MKKSTKSGLALSAAGSAAMMLLSQAAHANTLVATIIGAYDATCGTCSLQNGTTITSGASNNNAYDTPNLFFLNPTSHSFTNVTLTLLGYQDAAGNTGTANGSTFVPGALAPAVVTVTLAPIAANSVYHLNFGQPGTGLTGVTVNNGIDLFAYDYDDILGNAAGSGTTDSAGHTCGESGSGAPPSLCNFVGNYDVHFSATWNGKAISSDFSPDNTQDGGNVAGTFVGWEGLDQNGLSETSFDKHAGTLPGTLANIFTGTNQCGGTCNVPEPASLGLLGMGIGAIAFGRRRRKV